MGIQRRENVSLGDDRVSWIGPSWGRVHQDAEQDV